jgi:diacylglycerol kinase family enzyme
MPRTDLARMLLRIKRGEHLGLPGVHYVQLPELTIASRERITVNVDGEVSDADRLHYRARPRDLLVHVGHLPGEAPIG